LKENCYTSYFRAATWQAIKMKFKWNEKSVQRYAEHETLY